MQNLAPNDSAAVAVEIRTAGDLGDKTIRVLYSADPSRRVTLDLGVSFQGKYATLVSSNVGARVTLYDCSHFRMDGLKLTIPRRPALPVDSVADAGDGKYAVRLQGTWDDVLDKAPRVFEPPALFILAQDGDHHRAFPVRAVRRESNATLLDCSRHPGFEYDADAKVLKEVFTPFSTIAGKAMVGFPTRVRLRTDSRDPNVWRIRSTGPFVADGRVIKSWSD